MYNKLGQSVAMALVTIVSLYSACARAQERYCATRFAFCDGCDTFTAISVQTGHVCTINYQMNRFSTVSAIFGQKVVVRPRSGIYGTANETSGAYKPNDGFVGNDSFVVDITYERSGQRFVTHLKATVVVRP
jgi:hypothetical protein